LGTKLLNLELLFAEIQYAPLMGHYYRLSAGTELPEGLAIIADGRNVGGIHSPTHHTIYPTREMDFAVFAAKFLSCGWVYVGKKDAI
jgi:hypothetical protein